MLELDMNINDFRNGGNVQIWWFWRYDVMEENLREVGMAESKEQFIREVQEIMDENPKLFKAFEEETYN